MEGIVDRAPDGSFLIPHDYCERVLQRESLGARESAHVSLIDPHSLEKQARYPGPTWLDRMADGIEDRTQLRLEGFGKDIADAWKQRETMLCSMNLGDVPTPVWSRFFSP